MGSMTCTVVEWRIKEGRDQQFSTERQDWGLCLFVGNFCLFVLVGLLFMTAFKFISHKHQMWFLLLLSNVHHRVLKASVMSYLVS